MSNGPLLDRLAAVCGARHVREAGPVDAVAGVPARWVAAPGTPDELAGVVGLARDTGLAVAARGGGSKLDWGTPPGRLDILVDTARLSGLRQHAPGELVATVGAGTSLRAVQTVLAASGQRLALDPASSAATVGGVIATGEAGPLRHRYGGPTDLVTGVEFVRADGVLTGSGGTAGRTVAGYDLGRLICGSFGTLGIVVSATLRVHPAPAARAWVRRAVRTPTEVNSLVGELLTAAAAPAAVEVDLPAERPASGLPRSASGEGSLAVLLEGSPRGVTGRAAAVAALLGGGAAVVDEAPAWWGRYPFGLGDVALKLAAPAAELPSAVFALRDAVGAGVPVRGSPGAGVVYAALPGDLPAERLGAILAVVRTTQVRQGGSCVVLSAPSARDSRVDRWGDVPGRSWMRQLRDQFDPAGTLAPDRLPG
jgi:glycolate oxidase FAD binding subunit